MSSTATSIASVTPPTRLAQLRQRLRELGAKPAHEGRVLRAWSQVCSYDKKHSPAETFFPLALRNELPVIEAELGRLARLRSEHPAVEAPAGEQVSRLLVELHDGQLAESVLLPRGGLCVSAQVGCAVGCVFCMSGRAGLLRQLGSAEIVAQVALARTRRAVSKVVFMGMGEPAHNLDNVMEAIQLLGTHGGIAHKNLVLSTVGDVRLFERLMAESPLPNPDGTTSHSTRPSNDDGLVAGYPPGGEGRIAESVPLPNPDGTTSHSTRPSNDDGQVAGYPPGGEGANVKGVSCMLVRPALAVSLHTTDDARRAALLPRAPRIPVEELVERAEAYARATHYPTQYQWTLIAGVNDGDAEIERVSELLTGKYAVLNFIPFNRVDGLEFRRPPHERIAAIMHMLGRRGIYTRIRDSAGQEVEGACGQLRARAARQHGRTEERPSE